MARITDPKKLERIKRATMELVAKCGYNGVSISNIAKEAGVSNGYLYRHYNGKDDLIEELVESNSKLFKNLFIKMLDKVKTVEEIFYSFVTVLFKVAMDDPVLAKFFHTLVFDQNYEIKKRRDNDKEINELVRVVLNQGLENKEFSSKTTEADIKLIILTIPFSYISINLNDKEKFSEEKAKRIAEMCLNALR